MVETTKSRYQHRPSVSVSKRPTHETKSDATPNASARPDQALRRWLYGIILFFGLLIAMFVIAIALGWFDRGGGAQIESPAIGSIPSRYDGDRAMGYLVDLCDIGPRPSGSTGMQKQQEMLTRFFRDRGAEVSLQTFQIRHPEDGSDVELANLVASWNADQSKRFLFCAHYDTRPYPDQDRRNPRGRFVGANDGASGTAALMELANQFTELPSDIGVDIVMLDGEEFVFDQGRDDYFLGSTFFAKKYAAEPPPNPYQAGILLDMIGDKELKIYYETNSLKYARGVAVSLWKVAAKLRVRAFVSRPRHTIQDDHLPLNEIAKIPTVDLIDFDYPRPGFGAPSYWHTEHDIPENCSGESLAAVVWVVHQWLLSQSDQ
ncbi:Peptidase family M28 [Planctomycetes bacterium CA13]|uniref:Peptidase family M28 n=1 Tax=Novipirellula herctigrandis TaxID=2527986 RepID=A0A5C5Z5Y3_9BACT|nr:Peptidase family M28 [Planctomycetes bacterium CA13]